MATVIRGSRGILRTIKARPTRSSSGVKAPAGTPKSGGPAFQKAPVGYLDRH